jgi:anaerobic selenocysteine-containing dehydrogenase
MDCPDSCALDVIVADGKIARVQAAPVEKSAHPNTQGFICDKIGKFDRRVYHDSRILHPQRRVGPKGEGRFKRISWDEAIAIIVERFREIIARWGAEAILPYHYDGSNGLLSHDFLDAYFFAKLGASRLARTLCAAPASAVALGMYGKMPGVAFQDYPQAKAILVWGANPKYSNIHLVPYLRQAKKNGAFIAMIDPIRNFSSTEIDLHLPVYPGTDLPVALATIRQWNHEGMLNRGFLSQHADGLEPLLAAADKWPIARAAAEARVPSRDIETMARVFAGASPAVIRVGWGIERNQNGGQALAAVMAMPALLGKFGVRGGGYTLSNSGAAKLDQAKLFGADSPPARWNTRELNMSQLGRLLTDELKVPVQSLFIFQQQDDLQHPRRIQLSRTLAHASSRRRGEPRHLGPRRRARLQRAWRGALSSPAQRPDAGRCLRSAERCLAQVFTQWPDIDSALSSTCQRGGWRRLFQRRAGASGTACFEYQVR